MDFLPSVEVRRTSEAMVEIFKIASRISVLIRQQPPSAGCRASTPFLRVLPPWPLDPALLKMANGLVCDFRRYMGGVMSTPDAHRRRESETRKGAGNSVNGHCTYSHNRRRDTPVSGHVDEDTEFLSSLYCITTLGQGW